MSILDQEIQDMTRFEPLLMDILDPSISEQEARILSLIFLNGGYLNLNSISNKVGIAQPTVSVRVNELSIKGFLRKNDELMPIVLVLKISIDELRNILDEKFNRLKSVKEFLKQSIGLESDDSISKIMIKAFNLLFPKEKQLGHILTILYKHPFISRQNLYSELIPNEIKSRKEKEKLDQLIEEHQEYIQVVYKKFQKNETYFTSRLSLESTIESRFAYLKETYSHYGKLLDELKRYLFQNYDSVLPIHLLPYFSDLKQRIDSCLKKYTQIRIISNGIFQKSGKKDSIIDLIMGSKEFTNEHQINVLFDKGIVFSKKRQSQQVKYQEQPFEIEQDLKARDVILFKEHGCIIIPPIPNICPYYNISPNFIEIIKSIFEIHWK